MPYRRYADYAPTWDAPPRPRPAEQSPSAWRPLQDAAIASVGLAVAGELGALIAAGTGDPMLFVIAGEVALTPFLVVGAARLAVLVRQARADVAAAGVEAQPVVVEPDYYVEPDDNFHLVKVGGIPSRKSRNLENWRWAIEYAYDKGLSSRAWIGQRLPDDSVIDYERWRKMLGELARLGIIEGGSDRRAAHLAVPKEAAMQAFGFG